MIRPQSFFFLSLVALSLFSLFFGIGRFEPLRAAQETPAAGEKNGKKDKTEAAKGVTPKPNTVIPEIAPPEPAKAEAIASVPDKKKEGKTDKEELPAPEEVAFTTTDGVELKATYFPGTKGKESIPIVMLHPFQRNRNDFKELAITLQKLGYAVLTPDLRGHGQTSKSKETPTKISQPQLKQIATLDLPAIKVFLWERNNKGELNIDKLCLIGAEMGAALAMDFAALDATGYGAGQTHYGPLKLGGFVKSVVLVSPQYSYSGLSMQRALQVPALRNSISFLVLVGGEDSKAANDAKRIYDILRKDRPQPTDISDTMVFLKNLDSKLQSTKLSETKNLNIDKTIEQFLNLRIVDDPEMKQYEWHERKFPHGD